MPRFTVLEPMSTGDVIDRAVRLYRRNFTPLVAISAVPTITGYIVSLIFWYGVAILNQPYLNRVEMADEAVGMLVLGLFGYLAWVLILIATIAGLSRVVGDHVMMGEPITFRRCFSMIRRRLRDIIKLGFLSILILFGLLILSALVLGILAQIIGAILAPFISAGMPSEAAIALTVVIAIILFAAMGLFLSAILSRVVFLPQVVMIEGERPGAATARASRLGGGNWYRICAIALFAYFVRLSLFSAFTLPVLAALQFSGFINQGFFVSPTWSVISASFWEMAGLLSLPMWTVSLTLLYFDNRVRKEAYDLELLAMEVAPERGGRIVSPASALGFQSLGLASLPRVPVQTSPLGLAGLSVRQPQTGFAPPAAVPASQCKVCGAAIKNDSRFCSQCGSAI